MTTIPAGPRAITRLWPVLESVPGPAAPADHWRAALAEEYDLAAPLLRPADRFAASLVRQGDGNELFIYRVVEAGPEFTSLVCEETGEELVLPRSALLVLELNAPELARRLASALGFEYREDDTVPLPPSTYLAGAYSIAPGLSLPVYLTIPVDSRRLFEAVCRICSVTESPFLLLIPTPGRLKRDAVGLLERRRAFAMPLAGAVEITADGRWRAAPDAEASLARFLSTCLPSPAESFPPLAPRAGRSRSGHPKRTNEELVSLYLQAHPDVGVEVVAKETNLTKIKVWKTNAWKALEEQRLDEYFRDRPEATTADVKRDLGISPSKTVKFKAWAAHQDRKQRTAPPRAVRERPLEDAMIRCRADERAVDPSAAVDRRDSLYQAILEKADANVRGQLNGLAAPARDELIDYLLGTVDGNASEPSGSGNVLELLVQVTGSWLDEREQRDRHERRGGRRRSGG